MQRRYFIAAAGSVWLTADPRQVRASLEHATRAARGAVPVALEVLTPEQAADLDAVAGQIIPTDDLPGAREARVVNFIDHSLATWARDQREPLLSGLDDLNRRVSERWPGTGRFAQLPSEGQVELLSAVERTPFFQQLRFATVVGTFANPSWGGNADGAGWRILGFEPRYVWQPPFGDYDAEGGP